MSDQIAWVTGATGFWGREFTLSLLRQGWTVVALCRTEPHELLSWAEAQGKQLLWQPFDFGASNCLENLQQLPTPQAFFHCSALFDESIERMLLVNVSQPIHLLNHVIARMKQQDGGRLGVLLGQNGRLGLPGLGNFSATQGAIWTWSEAAARDLRKQKSKISISLVFPPRAPSRLQDCLGKKLNKKMKLKPLVPADRLVKQVLSGKPLSGRRPLIAGLGTLLGPI